MLKHDYSPNLDKDIVDIIQDFHMFFYHAKIWQQVTWLGVHILKSPFDIWILQEIITEVKPDVIVETGTFDGGNALFIAGVFDQLKNGRVITIDIENRLVPVHPRIRYLIGSSVSEEIVNRVCSMIYQGEKVMVILDSDHTKDHVSREIELYSQIVTPGSYLIVEDTNLNGHPIEIFGPGPFEAVQEFLSKNNKFESDRSRNKFGMTFNPDGYLRRNIE
jgi:cephalosporin hydroxylase